MQHSSWKSDNEWRISSVSSGLWCILLQSNFNHNLFFICFHVCERRQMDCLNSRCTWCKDMNSIKSLYLYFPLWDETKRKALEIICGCGGQKVFYMLFWGGNLLQNKPKRRCREGLPGAQLTSFSGVLTQLLPFDSLVVCFKLNVGVCIRK